MAFTVTRPDKWSLTNGGVWVQLKVEPPVERAVFWPCLPKRTRVPPPPATVNGAARKAALMAFYWTLEFRSERTLHPKSREPRTVDFLDAQWPL